MERVRQIEALIQQIESTADPQIRGRIQELLAAILEFHGAGIERMLELAGAGSPLVREFARDELISSILLLYDLHPEDTETRVRRAVDALPNLELTGIHGGRVLLRALNGGVSRDAVEQVICSAAPEIEEIEIDGLEPASPAFVPLESLLQH
jgi:hypothetical protein